MSWPPKPMPVPGLPADPWWQTWYRAAPEERSAPPVDPEMAQWHRDQLFRDAVAAAEGRRHPQEPHPLHYNPYEKL